jgi:hypothetical protein
MILYLTNLQCDSGTIQLQKARQRSHTIAEGDKWSHMIAEDNKWSHTIAEDDKWNCRR